MIHSPMNLAGKPFDIAEIDVLLVATGAGFSRNDVVQIPIDSDGGYTTCITPTAAGIGTVASAICSDACFGVVLGDVNGFGAVAQNGIAKVRIYGVCTPNVLSTADASLVAEGNLFPNTSKQLEYDQAAGDANKKNVGIVMVAVTGGGGATSTVTSRNVLFNGITGWSRNGGSAS